MVRCGLQEELPGLAVARKRSLGRENGLEEQPGLDVPVLDAESLRSRCREAGCGFCRGRMG